MLKKEFKKRDVTRIRNIIKGKGGDKTTSIIGFTHKQEFHKEGDIWEEDGKIWIIKNGIKQNITKYNNVRTKAIKPLFCPSCGEIMNHPFDVKFYQNHTKCYSCVIKMESELKRTGQYDEYKKRLHNEEIDNKIIEFREWVDEKLKETNKQYLTETGDLDNWVGNLNKEKIKNYMDDVINYLEEQKL